MTPEQVAALCREVFNVNEDKVEVGLASAFVDLDNPKEGLSLFAATTLHKNGLFVCGARLSDDGKRLIVRVADQEDI